MDTSDTTATASAFDASKLGQWSEPQAFAVEQERVKAYAAATNDVIPQHASGDLAPPVFAVVAAFQSIAMKVAEVTPPELLMMTVHGQQDFHFHRPIVPGMTLLTRSVATGFHARSSGVTVTAKAESADEASGELVCVQYMTSFVRGASAEQSAGDAAPGHAFPEELRGTEPIAEVVQAFDADQTYRYSEASGDLMPIHLDDDLAKAMGLPGIIIHGLCTMAFTSRAVIETACPEDPQRLKRLAVRFSKPCRPGQEITTRIYDAGGGALAYETTDSEGHAVIKDGRAEIA